MSNVLPEEAKRDAWRTYRARMIIAGSLVALLAAALSLVALLPSYLVLADSGRASNARSLQQATDQIERDALAQVRSLLTIIAPVLSASTTPSEVAAAALSYRPAHILIDDVSFRVGSPGTVVIRGTAQSREAINEYRQALMKDLRFKSVSVPVGDLARAEDGHFSITLTGDF